MSTKREELKAFERLKEEFPDKDVSLNIVYRSWSIDNNKKIYYAYVSDFYTGISEETETPDAAVDLMISKRV